MNESSKQLTNHFLMIFDLLLLHYVTVQSTVNGSWCSQGQRVDGISEEKWSQVSKLLHSDQTAGVHVCRASTLKANT